jgi:hypothetical protein
LSHNQRPSFSSSLSEHDCSTSLRQNLHSELPSIQTPSGGSTSITFHITRMRSCTLRSNHYKRSRRSSLPRRREHCACTAANSTPQHRSLLTVCSGSPRFFALAFSRQV